MPQKRQRHKLRTSIYQASWNYKYRDTYPLVVMIISIIAGLWSESWWVFLGLAFGLLTMPHLDRCVGIVSFIWALFWTLLISIPVAVNFSVGATVTVAIIVYSLTYVPMRSSEQYWRDLEKDGGPWAD